MMLHTMSEGITLSKKLEQESGILYENMAFLYPQNAEAFLSFNNENKKYIVQIERAYYGVISDALEGCFALNIDSNKYSFDMIDVQHVSYEESINKIIDMEEKIIRFYTDAAEQCQSLMADVPRIFSLIANKRKQRIQKVLSLLYGSNKG